MHDKMILGNFCLKKHYILKLFYQRFAYERLPYQLPNKAVIVGTTNFFIFDIKDVSRENLFFCVSSY